MTTVLKASRILLHPTSAPAFVLQWTCARCLIYRPLCWTGRTQAQTQAWRTVKLTTHHFNTFCHPFPHSRCSLLISTLIYNIIMGFIFMWAKSFAPLCYFHEGQFPETWFPENVQVKNTKNTSLCYPPFILIALQVWGRSIYLDDQWSQNGHS